MMSPTARNLRTTALIVTVLAVAATITGCGQAGRSGMTYVATGLPRLVDLGASFCIPCIMMAPSLEELKQEYAGRLQVEFIDAWENPGAKKQYGVFFCPTQIFIDASGKELFRHTGYYSKQDILARWKELGVDLEARAEPRDAPGDSAQPKTDSN